MLAMVGVAAKLERRRIRDSRRLTGDAWCSTTSRMRCCRGITIIAAVAAAISPLAAGPAMAGRSATRLSPQAAAALIRANAGNAEVATFANRRLAPVTIVRGKSRPPSPPATGGKLVDLRAASRRVARAGSEAVVAFADPRLLPVTVLRGARFEPPDLELFAPASALDLDRVAFAVDGAESSHGTDPRMWRPALAGPQGPMQVSAAAALDLGGGDRFDLSENRSLGRAYLARLFRRYGNWPDAIAAYNWGLGNVDAWIGKGRPAAALPLEVERYCDRVLRDTGLPTAPLPPAPLGN
jgi:hypothetical protein